MANAILNLHSVEQVVILPKANGTGILHVDIAAHKPPITETVRKLLQEGGDVNRVDLVYQAAEDGNVEALKLLLDDGKFKVETVNKMYKGKTPVYIAAQRGHKGCLRMLIERGGDLSWSCPEDGDLTVMHLVFEQISRPVEFVQDILDRCLSLTKDDGKNKYSADFRVLKSKPREMDVISSLLVAANDEEKTEVLQHPLIELYLTLKWSFICYFFYLWIAAYVLFVFAMSVYVTAVTKKYQMLEPVVDCARYVLLISAFGLLLHALLQCLLTRRKRFRNYEMWLNIVCVTLSLIVAIAEPTANIHSTPNWVLHVTSVAILLAWTELMLLIGRLPTYGYYALMFSAVLQNVIKVLSAFACLMVGFALSFSIQFHNYQQFGDPWRALVKTTVMMMGEFEYADLFAEEDGSTLPPTSRVIFLMFIILTSIVLMNLMVGLAVSDIQSLQKESRARKLEKQSDFLAQLDKIVYSKQLNSRYVPEFIKYLFRRGSIGDDFKFSRTAHFRRSNNLSKRLIDSLVSIAKGHRKNEEDGVVILGGQVESTLR